MSTHESEEIRRTQILEAAKRCFATHGYHETKVDDIAHDAGLSKGALYWYFKSKEELLGELCDYFSRGIEEVFLKAVEAKDIDPVYLLIEIGAMMMERAISDPDQHLIWMEHWSLAARDSESRKKHAAIHQNWLDITVPLVEQSIAEGRLRAVDPKQLMIGLMALFDGILAVQVFHPDLDAQKLWRSMTQMLIEGIKK